MVKFNTTLQDSAPLITYYGNVSESDPNNPDSVQYSGYALPDFPTFHNITKGAFTFDFNASSVYVYGTASPTGGPFWITIQHLEDGKVFIDDRLEGNSSSSETNLGSLLYFYHGLPSINASVSESPYPFTFHFDNTQDGVKGDFVLDYIILETDMGDKHSEARTITLDDTSPAFQYLSGQWDFHKSDWPGNVTKYFYNKTSRWTTNPGAQLKIDFRGSSIELYGQRNSEGFLAQLDNFTTVSIEEISWRDEPSELLCAFSGLEEGDHSLMLTNMGGQSSTYPLSLAVDYAAVITIDPKNLDGFASNSSASETSFANSHHSHTTLIAGIVASGVVTLIVITVSLVWCWRSSRRRRQQSQEPVEQALPSTSALVDLLSRPYTYDPFKTLNQESLDRQTFVDENGPSDSSSPANIAMTRMPSPLSTPFRKGSQGRQVSPKVSRPPQVDILPPQQNSARPAINGPSVPSLSSSSPPAAAAAATGNEEFAVDAGMSLVAWKSREQTISPPRYDPSWLSVPPLPEPDERERVPE